MLTTYGTLYLGLLHSPEAYKTISKKWLSTLIFFCLSFILGGILSTALVYVRYLPETITQIKALSQIAENKLPEDLKITWDTNQNTVQFSGTSLPISLETKALLEDTAFSISDTSTLGTYLFTLVDQEIDPNTSRFPESVVVFAKNGVQFSNPTTEQVGFIPYSELQTAVEAFNYLLPSVTEKPIRELLTEIEPLLGSINHLLRNSFPIVFLIVVPLLIIITLPNIVIASVFMILLLKLNNYALTISQTIRLTVVISCVAMVLNQLALLLYPAVNWPFYSITFWSITFYLLVVQKRIWMN